MLWTASGRESPVNQGMCLFYSALHIGQDNVIRGLEVAEGGEITGLPVPGGFREKYSIYKSLYNDRKGSVQRLL